MLNSHSDKRLTKDGGMSFEVWLYILTLEMKAHGNPVGPVDDPLAWRDFWKDDHTPHSAVEEDFNAGVN